MQTDVWPLDKPQQAKKDHLCLNHGLKETTGYNWSYFKLSGVGVLRGNSDQRGGDSLTPNHTPVLGDHLRCLLCYSILKSRDREILNYYLSH